MVPGSVSRSLHSWNTMISSCVQCNQGLDALKLFNQMQAQGVNPNAITFARVINACASLMALEEGRHVHAQVIEKGCESDVHVGNTLVDMYAKCGSIEEAQKVFHKMSNPNVVSWTTMLAGYVKCQQGQKALEQFFLMQEYGVKPNAVTFLVVLNACASLMALEKGRLVHSLVIESGCESHMFVGSALVDMYAKCGSIVDAQKVFDKMHTRDVVSWNVMLAAYVKCEQGQTALELFYLMQQGCWKPNAETFVAVLNACASLGDFDKGRRIHAQVIQSGLLSNMFVGNALVDMYAKCGRIEDAEKVFHQMGTRNVVSWNALIAGYVKCEKAQRALEKFALIVGEGLEPNAVTFMLVLNACASLMSLAEGRRVHALAIESGLQSDLLVGNTLVDMYAKCGSIEDAQEVFQKMQTRDVVSWNAMLGGFAIHGKAKEALQLFEAMHQAGVEKNMVTFICLLSACSHGGLVEEGFQLFESMSPVHGMKKSQEHYSCMVDLLGRAGRLDEAEEFLKREPRLAEYSAALRALLGACRNHGNVEIAKPIAQKL